MHIPLIQAVRWISSWLEPLLVVLFLQWYYTSNMEQNKDRKILSTNTRSPVELRESLLRLAKKQKRSFNAEVMWAFQRDVEQQEERNALPVSERLKPSAQQAATKTRERGSALDELVPPSGSRVEPLRQEGLSTTEPPAPSLEPSEFSGEAEVSKGDA